MASKEFKSDYQELSAEGRAFLERLVRRKQIRGHEVPPLYQRLLEDGDLQEKEVSSRPSPLPQPPETAIGGASVKAELLASPPPLERHPLATVEESLSRYPQAVAGLSPTARRAYTFLLALGVEMLSRKLGRALPRSVSQVTAFVVNRLLAHALGVSEATLYRAVAQLENAGLVRRRPWRVPATVQGRTGMHVAGAVYAIRLPHKNRTPRLEREDFLHPWRDLEEDIRRGRTAWRLVRECKKNPPKEDSAFQLLLGWTLSPSKPEDPLPLHSLTGFLRQAKAAERRLLVQRIALGLAKAFADPGSVRAYTWILWGAVRAEIYGAHDRALDVVAWAIRRTLEAVATSRGSRVPIRRPGALFMHLLATEGVLSLIRSLPAWRVA